MKCLHYCASTIEKWMSANAELRMAITMPKMSLTKLKAILQAAKLDATSDHTGKLADDRATVLDYYQGDMSKDMPAIEGRSRAVSMDVSDTIEGIMPSLMAIFCSSQEGIRFDPTAPEEVPP